MTNLKTKYEKEVLPQLAKEFGATSVTALPKIAKVVVNMGVGELSKNKEALAATKADLAAITGQAPSVREARLSVASFNLREGSPVGLTVTLRGERMYAFLERLFAIVLPRLRDFRGVKTTSFDSHGNYTLGLAEHTVFPEIDSTKTGNPRGLEITIVTTTDDREQALRLLTLLGMPFEKAELN